MSTEGLLAKSFQANQKDHVLWFKSLFQLTKLLTEPMTSNTQTMLKETDLNKILQQNPMGIKVKKNDNLNFPMIHMAVALRYAEAVLEGQAWIPESQKEEDP